MHAANTNSTVVESPTLQTAIPNVIPHCVRVTCELTIDAITMHMRAIKKRERFRPRVENSALRTRLYTSRYLLIAFGYIVGV